MRAHGTPLGFSTPGTESMWYHGCRRRIAIARQWALGAGTAAHVLPLRGSLSRYHRLRPRPARLGGNERHGRAAVRTGDHPLGGCHGTRGRYRRGGWITALRKGLAFFEHDLPVTLRAEDVPEGIYITFNPATGIPDPQFTSRMLVAHAGAPTGSYSFTVRATGTDGRTLSLPFALEVASTGQATATPDNPFLSAVGTSGQ